MPKLINLRNGREIASHVEVADTLVSRLVGLLGRSSLESGRALWIKDCGSVHTWFMRFPIDVVFLDSEMRAVRVHRGLRPWRVTPPTFRRLSAVELPAGALDEDAARKGDRFHVGD